MRLSIEMSMSAVGKELGEPDSNLWRVFNEYVTKAIATQINLKDTRRIGVDETASKRGHNYVTIFTDLDTGDVIKVEEGRKKEVFEKLYGWLFDKEGHPKNIDLFSMDMSVSYKAGCRENFAHSEIVFDRFHIKKVVNEAVDKVRKAEVKHCDNLKKTKYLWLKNEQNLNEQQKEKLHEFLSESSLETTLAYKMKVEFDNFWKVQPKAVEPMLQTWMQRVLSTNITAMNNLIKTIKNNYSGIIKSMKTGINNAAAEGLNSIVQMAKSRARGFRNMDNFRNMIYVLGNDFNFKFHTK